MPITLLAFGPAKELLGFEEKDFPFLKGDTPTSIMEKLEPQFHQKIPTTRVAVNLEYVDWNYPLKEGQTLAIIPSVTGG